MSYIGTTPVPQSIKFDQIFTAVAGQTTFGTLGYQPTFIDVYLNGVLLVPVTDYTATNGSEIVLTVAAAAADILQTIRFAPFNVTNATQLRTDMGINKVVLSKSGDYTLLATDRGKVIRATADITLTIPAAATSGDGFFFTIIGDGGSVTLAGGNTAIVVADGSSNDVACNGSAYFAIGGGGGTSFNTKGIAKVVVSVNQQSTQNLRYSQNVASITDQGTGRTLITYTNDFSSVNYLWMKDYAGKVAPSFIGVTVEYQVDRTASAASLEISSVDSYGTRTDGTKVEATGFGDLA